VLIIRCVCGGELDVRHRRPIDIADRPVRVEQPDENVRVVEEGLLPVFVPPKFALLS